MNKREDLIKTSNQELEDMVYDYVQECINLKEQNKKLIEAVKRLKVICEREIPEFNIPEINNLLGE